MTNHPSDTGPRQALGKNFQRGENELFLEWVSAFRKRLSEATMTTIEDELSARTRFENNGCC